MGLPAIKLFNPNLILTLTLILALTLGSSRSSPSLNRIVRRMRARRMLPSFNLTLILTIPNPNPNRNKIEKILEEFLSADHGLGDVSEGYCSLCTSYVYM
eukprot:1337779-Amorphochlora_amoeboformis.AAC.1